MEAWNLRSTTTDKKEEERPMKFRRTDEIKESETEPPQQWLTKDVELSTKTGWVLLVTDNKALADILNGEEEYKGKDTRIIQNMESITDHLAGISMEGWINRETGHNYLLWRPREQNKLADYMANKAMNEKQSWQWTWPGVKQIRSVPSYQFFTDGGRRNESSASAAWVIFIIINGGFKLAGHGGHFLTTTDSFQA